MHVDVAIQPAKDCRVGTELLWPLHGERLLWVIDSIHPDGHTARCAQSADILIIPRMDFPVPVVVRKTYAQQQRYAQTFGSSSGTGSNTFFYQGTSNG